MKITKIQTLTLIAIMLLVHTTPALSAAPTDPESTASSESAGQKLNQQINQLKERIASRVAELNLVEKRGIIGTVSQTSGNQITITDMADKTRYIDVDEITKFASDDSKDFGLSDLVKGTKISIVGLYNKQTQRLLARFIEEYTTPVYLSGRIADIDRKNFAITVVSENQKHTKADIQTTTVTSTYTKEDGITKAGFSKLNIGDNAKITGFPSKDDPEIIAATRVLILNELPANPKIIIPELPNDEDATPTPQITKRLTPTRTSSQ
jgi:hypothetical protein